MLPPMTRRIIVTTIAGTLGCAAPAFGQAGNQDTATPEFNDTPSPVQVSLSASALYTPSADFDDAGGDVSVFRAGGKIGLGISLSPTMRAQFGFGTEQSFYDFSNGAMLVSGVPDPWDDVHAYDITAQISAPLNGAWSAFLGGEINSSAESGADFGDSLTYGGIGGVRYRVSDSLTVGIGVAVSSRLEDDTRIIPLPMIDWQIDEYWSFGSWEAEGQGAGYALRYQPSEELTLGVGAAYVPREFRLDEDGPVPEGVGRDNAVPVMVFAQWAPDPGVSFRADIGADVYRKLEVLNSAGNSIGEDEVNTAFTFGLSATFRF